tara:strand:- start:302 stop:622 length:321 start_codon:yes stop_codon:yes gene_type:complete
MFSKGGGMGGMVKKAQQMQKKMAEIQGELESIEVVGESGGGMVKVTVSGKKKIVSIDINEELLNEDKEMLEDLVLVATNQALDKVDAISKDKLGGLTGGMSIPGLF